MTRFTPQWLQAGSYAASIDRRLIGALWPTAATSGMAVTVSAAMTLNIAAGQCAVPTANNTGSALCSSDAVEQVTLTAAPASGSNRIDLVCCQVRGTDIDGGTDNDFIFSVVAGTVAASPVAPAVPANAVALAQVYVTGGTAAIVAGNITDRRPTSVQQIARPWNTAWGQIGGAIATAQVAIALNGSANVPGMSLANVPFVAGRRYRFTVNLYLSWAAGAATTRVFTQLTEDGGAAGNVMNLATVLPTFAAASAATTFVGVMQYQPTAPATHSYVVGVGREFELRGEPVIDAEPREIGFS